MTGKGNSFVTSVLKDDCHWLQMLFVAHKLTYLQSCWIFYGRSKMSKIMPLTVLIYENLLYEKLHKASYKQVYCTYKGYVGFDLNMFTLRSFRVNIVGK